MLATIYNPLYGTAYYIMVYTCMFLLCMKTSSSEIKSLLLPSKVTTPQDADKRLVLQVYLGSNTSEFSAICR